MTDYSETTPGGSNILTIPDFVYSPTNFLKIEKPNLYIYYDLPPIFSFFKNLNLYIFSPTDFLKI
nr:MAG TPA: hypothetical protein [Caudoviricetes sp.]